MSNLPMRPHIQTLQVLKARGVITVADIAEILDCSERHVQAVLADPTKDFQAGDWLTISRFLSERGFLGPARQGFVPVYDLKKVDSAEANGIIDDEIADAVQVLGKMKEKFDGRCSSGMQEQITEFEAVVNRLKAELGRLK